MKKHFSLALLACALAATACLSGAHAAETAPKKAPSRPGTNAACRRALARPRFRMTDPVGPVFTEAQKTRQWKAGGELVASLRQAAERGNRYVRVKPGNYRLPGLTGVTLDGLHDLTIDAEDATFWIACDPVDALKARYGLTFANCRNVRLKGAVIDADPLAFTQGTVVEINQPGNFIDMELNEGFPFPPDGYSGPLLLYRADGEFMPSDALFHEKSRLVEGRRFRIFPRGDLGAKFRDPVLLRAYGDSFVPREGDYCVLPFQSGVQPGRPSSAMVSYAISLENCDGLILEDVSIYCSPGIGILESGGQGGNVFRRVVMTRRPRTRRLFAMNAGGFHSRCAAKGALLDGCEIAHCGDDVANIHGFYGLVIHRYSPDRYAIAARFCRPFGPGRPLKFQDFFSVDSLGEAAIVRSDGISDPAILAKKDGVPARMGVQGGYDDPVAVTLDRGLPVDEGTLVDLGGFDSPGFAVRNCFFHDSPGRGLVLNGPANGVIENNVWRNTHSGPVAHMESGFSMEGPCPHDLVLRGNTIIPAVSPCPRGPEQDPVQGSVYVGLVPRGRYLRSAMPVYNIAIDGNWIENGPVVLAYVTRARVANNAIVEPCHYAARLGGLAGLDYYGKPVMSAIYTTVCTDIEITGNVIADKDGSCTGMLEAGFLTKNIWVDGKPLPDAPSSLATDYSGVQGRNGWRYGCRTGNGPYVPAEFVEFPLFDGAWRMKAGERVPFISGILMRPAIRDGRETAIVRRWTGDFTGTLVVSGILRGTAGGGGTVARICLDGDERWRQDVNGPGLQRFETRILGLRAGSTLDLVVGPRGNAGSDTTLWNATLTRFPDR